MLNLVGAYDPLKAVKEHACNLHCLPVAIAIQMFHLVGSIYEKHCLVI